MEYSPPLRRVVRFGVFEVDLQSGGLRKSELKIRMQERPFQVLAGLLSRNGSPYLYPTAEERPWRPHAGGELSVATRLVNHARYYWLLLVQRDLTRRIAEQIPIEDNEPGCGTSYYLVHVMHRTIR